MSDDALRGRIVYDGTRTPLKTALFLLVCAAWLLPGLVGHDPWKGDEAITFGAVLEMLRSGDWLAFRIAGEAYLEKAPLFLWTAAAFAKLFGGILPLHDAARLASGFYMAVTLGLLSLASGALVGERAGRMGVLLFIGCVGLLIRAHELTPELAVLAACALALLGLAMASRRALAGGALAGAGVGLAFLADGFTPTAMLVLTLIALPAISTHWRTRSYAATLGVALACAVPVAAVWPIASALAGGEAWSAWRANAAVLPQVPDPRALPYFLRMLPWYAWPALPLAAWTVWRARRTLRARPEVLLPLVAFAAFLLALAVFGEPREPNALALLVPLALLGVAELETLPRGAASALDWFGMTTFFLLAVLLWLGWAAAITGTPQFAAAWLQKEVPGFTYRFSFLSFALAALLSLIWLAVAARSSRTTRRALVNWTAGITMVWMLVMTLGVPLVDQARSYRGVALQLREAMPRDATCVKRRNVGDGQRALLDYFAGVRTLREDAAEAARCELLLVQVSGRGVPDLDRWEMVWSGSRPGDRNERFVLYRRGRMG